MTLAKKMVRELTCEFIYHVRLQTRLLLPPSHSKRLDFIGNVSLPVKNFLDGQTHSGWHEMADTKGVTGAVGSLLLEITLTPVQ